MVTVAEKFMTKTIPPPGVVRPLTLALPPRKSMCCAQCIAHTCVFVANANQLLLTYAFSSQYWCTTILHPSSNVHDKVCDMFVYMLPLYIVYVQGNTLRDGFVRWNDQVLK